MDSVESSCEKMDGCFTPSKTGSESAVFSELSNPWRASWGRLAAQREESSKKHTKMYIICGYIDL